VNFAAKSQTVPPRAPDVTGLTKTRMAEIQSLKIACPSCAGHVEFPSEMRGQIINCPHCGLSMALDLPGTHARRTPPRTKTQTDETPELLPILSDESLRAIQVKSSDGTQNYTVNLLDYTCTCPSFVQDHAQALPFTFGRMCKHICAALDRAKLRSSLPSIAQAMVREGHGIYPGRIAHDLNGNLIYITAANSAGWLNVFALPRRNGKTYSRFGYNINEARWAYGMRPKIDESLLPSGTVQTASPGMVANGRKWWHVLLSVLGWILKVVLTLIGAVVVMAVAVLAKLILSSGKSRHRRR
jgi:hypothetical protein